MPRPGADSDGGPYPCEEPALAGAIDTATQGLIVPIMGPAATIVEIAKAKAIDLGGAQIVNVAGSHASAAKLVAPVRQAKPNC